MTPARFHLVLTGRARQQSVRNDVRAADGPAGRALGCGGRMCAFRPFRCRIGYGSHLYMDDCERRFFEPWKTAVIRAGSEYFDVGSSTVLAASSKW